MAKKKTAPSKKQNKTYTIQRGGEEFEVVEAATAFAVKRKRVTSSAELIAVAQAPDRFPGLRFDKDRSPRGVELYYVDQAARDSAMEELRTNSPDVAWCSHVFHTPADPESMFFPMDTIYVELKPTASNAKVNKLLDQYGLELIPDPDGDPNVCVMRLTSQSTENPLKIANALRKSGAVVLAEPDLAVKGNLTIHRPSDDLFSLQWHLENKGGAAGLTAGADVSATEAWDITRGSRNITVAVIDDGFDTGHPDFASVGKVRAPRDFGQADADPSPVSQFDNHGTACAGVAVADENGSGVVGMSPECGLMPIRWSGSVSDADIRDQFDHPRLSGADVISCSWGVTSDFFTLSTSMKRSIAKAAAEGRSGKGCVIVFAAGNANHDIDDPPRTRDGFAIHPDVIAVAASNSRDRKSHYSNFGDAIWVCAPSSGAGGLGIVTTDRRGTSGYQSGDYTTVERFGGTSSATPLVAGVCALMLSVNPELTAEEVKEILKETAEKIDPQGGNYNNGRSRIYGFGRVNAHLAVLAARDRRTTSGVTELRFESNAELAIPDHQPAGVADAVFVNRAGSVETVQVEVDITHTYRGDLKLTLISPQGTAVTLFGRTAPVFDGTDNLVARFTEENVPALAAFSGESASGNWSLQVADLAAVDIGILNTWILTLGLSTQQTEWHIAPGLAIPDNNAAGITSELNVDAGGILKNISVSVDITHTYRGDLSVAVASPSGIEVLLKSVDSGDGTDDFRQTFTTTDTPDLLEFINRSNDIRGTWKLHVRDNLSADVGKLNAWSLKLIV